jgi:hypothetical protein
MKILVACEESQAVCKAFRARGHEAYSADIQEPSGGHPEWHILGDVLPLIDGDCTFRTMDGQPHRIISEWDMIIAFPPCTDLAASGARSFARKRADGSQERSKQFFLRFTIAKCKRIAIENPVGIMSTCYRKPTQIVQPWYFGEDYQKTTCLWLIGLPKLIPTVTEKPDFGYYVWIDKKTGKQKRQTQWYYDTRCQGKRRGKVASKTPQGLANAMAEQWGCLHD